ncbi:uncharacterized protein PV09_07942 [Verruconis gallopava]|uniref:Helicase ATP-binding domain-containing protein n=1 Tax=Verruconis gallopava TaxID=253628 RepID=A0A0D2AN93_9PEZI|nr:uncharacterized protein PV09_07942 [Verruconis gallopava]KIW00589.1 hypothetical protein PV09_07942 [Verruconis gallopava]
MFQSNPFKVLFSDEEINGSAVMQMSTDESFSTVPVSRKALESHASLDSSIHFPPLSGYIPSTSIEEWTTIPKPDNQERSCKNLSPSISTPQPKISQSEVRDLEPKARSNEKAVIYSNSHKRPNSTLQDQSNVANKFHSNRIRKYVEWLLKKRGKGSWIDCPEIPTAKELMDENEPWMKLRTLENGSEEVVMEGNRLHGGWPDVETYLGAHYGMLREETVQPLRQAIAWIKAFPTASEDISPYGSIGIYSKVHITAITFSPRGLAIRVVFSLSKVGKKIRWEQSKRLLAGSLVALTPSSDIFKTKCIVATVAARPLDMLTSQDLPPMVDLFLADTTLIDLDPTIEYTMVEDRTSFFEAVRHIAISLQRLTIEEFPLKQHIVHIDPHITAPEYIKKRPALDLSVIFQGEREDDYRNVDVLRDWPKTPITSLDKSQLNALHSMFKQRLALIQGPPGTGKTYVSVMALKGFIKNMTPDDPPIVVACQTNHALDQLLRHVAEFEEAFVRLGGRSKDTGIVKQRTLYHLRQKKENRYKAPSGMQASARRSLELLEGQIRDVIAPLEYGKDQIKTSFLSLGLYHNMGVLTKTQCDNIERGDKEWAAPSDYGLLPLEKWLGSCLQYNQRYFEPDNIGGFEFEEADLEFEQLQELEAENIAQDDIDHDFESLPGNGFPIFLKVSGKSSAIGEGQIERWLENDDMWKIPPRHRGAVFNHMQRKAIRIMNERLRELADRYNEAALRYRYGGFENNAILVRQQKVIGVTTTGLSKYRALIAAACPRLVMIEEAAETMESPVTAGCVPSLEHLILVGDHKQLRPQCSVKSMEEEPFNLNVSMFERLVGNNLPYNMLKRQRRMIPEIRRLLVPIYRNEIYDHTTVCDPKVRPPIPGMGGINTFFYSHSWHDTADENMSSTNIQEANMVVGFYDYLISNGLTEDEITILTFYNGQRKLLLRKLRNHRRLRRIGSEQNRIFKVFTVDSYQGEEDEVILLSLVRSNEEGNIGFTGVENRICVALSRAKRGFYLFGNAELLASECKLWAKVIEIMLTNKSSVQVDGKPVIETLGRVVFRVPLQCSNHNKRMFIECVEDWDKIDGGCEKPCKGILSCGHPCTLKCHPFGHEKALCLQHCAKTLDCGHQCINRCCDKCRCPICGIKQPGLHKNDSGFVASESIDDSGRLKSSPEKWQEFALGGVHKHDAILVETQRKRYREQQMRKFTAAVEQAAAEGQTILQDARDATLCSKVGLQLAAASNHDVSPVIPPSLAAEVKDSTALFTPEMPQKAKISHRDRFKRSCHMANLGVAEMAASVNYLATACAPEAVGIATRQLQHLQPITNDQSSSWISTSTNDNCLVPSQPSQLLLHNEELLIDLS